MVDKNRQLLENAIESIINSLNGLEVGSKEHSMAIEDLTKLYKLKIDEIKTDLEQEEKFERRIMDHTQAAEQKRIGRGKLALDLVGIGLPLMFYGVWLKRGFRFEETGTYCSKTFMHLFNRFKPTK